MMTTSPGLPASGTASTWLDSLRAYLGIAAAGNLAWEILQLPFYTIWSTGTPREQVFAVLHCTLGDLLIALSTLTLALVVFGDANWPASRFRLVAGVALMCGVAYAVFSEWLNVTARGSWAYSAWMPIVPIGGLRIGLSPLLQWIVVPAAGFAVTRGAMTKRSRR